MESDGSLPCSQNIPLVPVLRHRNPVHTTTSYFSKTHYSEDHIVSLHRSGTLSLTRFSSFSFKDIQGQITLIDHDCVHKSTFLCYLRILLSEKWGYDCVLGDIWKETVVKEIVSCFV
jgi:hypothetical protein